MDGTRTVNGYPSGYSNTGSIVGSGLTATLGFADKATTASTTDDPSTFTFSAGDYWIAHTIAITPASAGGTAIISDDSPMPGVTVAFTCGSAFAGTITTMTTAEGDAISAEGGADTCDADFIIPAVSNFVASGSMQNSKWGVAATWTVGDGTTTENIETRS